MYIYRELLEKIEKLFLKKAAPKGLILSGIVGCGKTTLLKKLEAALQEEYQIFNFTGDDTVFRKNVADNSKYISDYISSRTNKKSLAIVDEVQKSEDIFDAIKYAFDKQNISFIVTGSNPAYLSTIAKKRLQRRADQFLMLPISLLELCVEKKFVPENVIHLFSKILWEYNSLTEISTPPIALPENFPHFFSEYFTFGGLPLVFTANNPEDKFREIRLTVERGFELLNHENNNLSDAIRIELAELQSKEFTYKNILEKTRTRRRELINKALNELLNYGYIVKKTPTLLKNNKSSYHSVFSYIDPGIVNYLKAQTNPNADIGFLLEGYIHARLTYLSYNSSYKSQLGYYKPNELDSRNNIRFLPGEIDFIFQSGKRILPIEVKMTSEINQINTALICKIIKTERCLYGIIVYGGAPHIDHEKKIIYWPYWLI